LPPPQFWFTQLFSALFSKSNATILLPHVFQPTNDLLEKRVLFDINWRSRYFC